MNDPANLTRLFQEQNPGLDFATVPEAAGVQYVAPATQAAWLAWQRARFERKVAPRIG